MAITMRKVQVHRGELFDATDAGRVLGVPGAQLRLWIRMGLLHAKKVGNTYAIRAEDLAYASQRYHQGMFADVPRSRDGGEINFVELVSQAT